MAKKLTTKQQRFVDFYEGNAVDACRLAGYTHPESASRTLVQNHTIMGLIHNREKKRNNPKIANREERQAFWSSVTRGEETQVVIVGSGEDAKDVEVPPKMADRLKASELLGKSEADFVEITRHTDGDGEPLFGSIEFTFVHVDKKDVNEPS